MATNIAEQIARREEKHRERTIAMLRDKRAKLAAKGAMEVEALKDKWVERIGEIDAEIAKLNGKAEADG